MKIGANITGLKELGEALKRLSEELQVKILREAGKEAMKPVLDDMKAHAGYDNTSSGEHMRDSITIRSTRSKKTNGAVMITVGPSKKHHMKALAQEIGTVKQVAKPFIRPALDYNKQAVLKTLVTEIRDAIRRFK